MSSHPLRVATALTYCLSAVGVVTPFAGVFHRGSTVSSSLSSSPPHKAPFSCTSAHIHAQGRDKQTNLFGQMNPIDLAHLKGCGSSPGGSSSASPQELRAADLDQNHPHLKHGDGCGVLVAECITEHIKPSCATLSRPDLAAVGVLAAVLSLINKWVATFAQGVTHSREAVLRPLMTINVNRTISAHPL